MKNFICILAVVLVPVFLNAQKKKPVKSAQTQGAAKETVKIPLTPDTWEFQEGKVSFLEYKGVSAVKLNENSGNMIYKNLNFINGTIEFDVEVNQAQPFPGIFFRWQNIDEAELVYLRTGAATRRNAFDAVQYSSIIKGVNLWDLQHEYQSSALLKIGEWNHIKLVVSGKQLKVFVNNPSEPDLYVPCMEGGIPEGKIALGTGFPGEAVFANLVVSPGATEGLDSDAGADITQHDTRYIRNWQVSKPDSLPYGREPGAFMLPKPEMTWGNIQAERRGLVNLTRKFGGSNYRRFVWLRVKIKSEFNQVQHLKLGFSDEIWVFVNQRPVYVDKNIYFQNMRKSPNGRISLDNCSFLLPLNKGENELIIALSNDFYGWGLMARLENLDGIEFL